MLVRPLAATHAAGDERSGRVWLVREKKNNRRRERKKERIEQDNRREEGYLIEEDNRMEEFKSLEEREEARGLRAKGRTRQTN
jgi:hypothetical protein